MASISTSLEAPSHSEFNQAIKNHNNDIHQQYANMAIIMKKQDLNSLNQFGGVKGFADTLGIDLEQGRPSDLNHDLQPVQLWPQSNTSSQHSELIHILENTCNKYHLLLILLSAILLLILGIKEEGWETGWYQGVLIFLAIVFLITVSVTCKYWLLLRWSKTNTPLSSYREISVNVLRGGQQCMIPRSKVGLGDILCLNVGEEVFVDGLFVQGESLKLDEESQPTISDQYPFLFCGSKVIHGKGHMMVTAVGKDIVLGGMKSHVKKAATNKASLQLQLDKLNTWMQGVALVVTNLLIIVTLLRITFHKGHDHPGSPDLKRQSGAMREFIDILEDIITNNNKNSKFIPLLTMILQGFSEWMPLMVTLAIGYWNKKATSDKATTRDFMACVTAGSVTVICTDILEGRIQSEVEHDVYIGEERITEKSNIGRHVHEALCDGIGSTLSELQRPVSSMEHALLSWAPVNLGLEINNMKDQYRIIDKKELVSSEVNGVLMSKNIVDPNSSHWNGPPAEILQMCSHYYGSAGELKPLVGGERENIEAIVENALIKYPKSIAFGYKPNTPQLEETGLILTGTVGLKHTFNKAMEAFMEAGVTVKLVSKRSVAELKTMALQWGLISNMDSDHSVIHGDQFREYTHEQRMEMVDKICIMGNSSQSDKLTMVKCLKEKAHKVLMVGMESDDVPSMLESDLGISMGECFTEAVKGSSKIVISQGNFSTLLSIMKFGQCARENIPKFILIELTMAFTGLLINIISTSCSGDCPITSIQFFWISLIVPFFGSLALLTMWPNDVMMKKTLERGTETLVPITMWRRIAVEVICQTTILVIFRYSGPAVLGITSKEVVATMMFNSFVLCQVFSWFNAREMTEKNVLSEISRNCWFWVAIGVILALQVTYTEIAHIIANNARLNISQWGVCFLIGGASSSVVYLLSKCIPDISRGFLLFKQQCFNIKSPCMSMSPSSSGPPSLHGLPVLEDDSQGLLATIDSIQPCGGESL